MMHERRMRQVPLEVPTKAEVGNKAAEGAGIGGVIGGVIGAMLAVAATSTTIVVPGLGLVAAGPIAAGLAGAGAGGLAGSIVGALVGAGIPEERARLRRAQGDQERWKRRGVLGIAQRRSRGAAIGFGREWKSHRGGHVSP